MPVQGQSGSIMGVFFVALFGIFGASLNAIRYVEMLGDPLRPFMLLCYSPCNGVFQQDNCTSHKSRLGSGRLDEHSSDFSIINWPLGSPDLNRIEHLRDVLEPGVKGHL
ncbi:transposable element Tcb2 transposase [Trichonephila clavipes]|nr:transposable element Tcb2 transposase [Trichonephila clavipes]